MTPRTSTTTAAVALQGTGHPVRKQAIRKAGYDMQGNEKLESRYADYEDYP